MRALTPEKIAILRQLDMSLVITDQLRECVQAIADTMRSGDRGIDDVDIGCVVLDLATAMHAFIRHSAVPAPVLTADLMVGIAYGVGLDLTAIEWQEAPTS